VSSRSTHFISREQCRGVFQSSRKCARALAAGGWTSSQCGSLWRKVCTRKFKKQKAWEVLPFGSGDKGFDSFSAFGTVVCSGSTVAAPGRKFRVPAAKSTNHRKHSRRRRGNGNPSSIAIFDSSMFTMLACHRSIRRLPITPSADGKSLTWKENVP
jgi:hypothetical protein